MNIDCRCPTRDGSVRHPDGDTVNLRETLDFRTANTLHKSIQLYRHELSEDGATASVPEVLAMLTEGYVLYGIESWSLTDEDNKPLPVTKGNIERRILTDITTAERIGDAADELYAEKVMLPLLQRESSSSPPLPTDESTSAPTDSPPEHPTPSRPSLITTSQTADIEPTTTSLDGDSSLSQSSTSAA